MEGAIRLAVVTTAGILLWVLASFGLHSAEPWDSPGYWTAYFIALGLSCLSGYLVPQHAWLCGLVIIYAQVPVMWVNDGEVGSLWVMGVILVGILAIPAMGLAAIASRFARSRAT